MAMDRAEKRSQAERKTQEERLDWLLHEFKEDSGTYRDLEVGDDYEEKRMALRSLMNIRMPGKMADDVVRVQDEFLSEEAREKGIVDVAEIPTAARQYGSGHLYADKISVWQGDITTIHCGAIVNAANSQMLGCFWPCHGCIDNAIHTFAGVQLRLACAELMEQQGHEEETGKAKITPAFNLPCRYVLHTVGPIIQGWLTKKDRELLASCYRSCLELAEKNNLRNIAFCCISTGEFHFPNDKAAQIAIQTVKAYKAETHSQIEVIFNVFKETDFNIYRALLGAD